MADKVLHYNLDRYPEGVFFLYFAGRLYSTQTLGDKAIKQFGRAINAQREYIQLQHICVRLYPPTVDLSWQLTTRSTGTWRSRTWP